MARYIDADALKERLFAISVVPDDLYGMGINRGLDRAETAIDMMPTADVIPRVEMDDLIYKLECLLCHATGSRLSKHTYDLRTMETVVTDYIQDAHDEGYDEGYAEATKEVAGKIFEEIEKIIQKNYESAQNNEEDEELEAATDYLSYVSCDLDELKKKYPSEDTEL